MPTTKLQRRGIPFPFATTMSKELANARTRMRRLMEEPFADFLAEPFGADFLAQPVGWYPAVEVGETDDEFIVTAELPGLTKKDVQVDFDDGILTIRGDKEEKKEEKENGKRYHLYERSYGSFQRSLTFPFADPEKISAEFADGILTIHLPKVPGTRVHGRKIAISEKK